MPYARKSGKISRKRTSRKGTVRRSYRRSNIGYRKLSKRISAVSRRVAGEVFKYEMTPTNFSNSLVVVGSSNTPQKPLDTISSGVPWIMPLNWSYVSTSGNTGYVNGEPTSNGASITTSFRNPIWFNTSINDADYFVQQSDQSLRSDISPGLQYRMKYLYINALFNASINSSVNNTDGALRIVIVKDKQPTGGAATWADSNDRTNSRGVFNANRIDAQLNPNTVGRFKIMYDKTLRFNNTNGYKPFKYYKQLSTIVRNTRDIVPAQYLNASGQAVSNINLGTSTNYVETSERPPPVLKNAFYLMIFSDGLTFSYSDNSETPAAGFHLFERLAYYNN